MKFSLFGYIFTVYQPKKNTTSKVEWWNGEFEDALILREYKDYNDLGYF